MIVEISQLWSGAKTRDGREISRAWTSDEEASKSLLVECGELFYVIPEWDKYRSLDRETPCFKDLEEAKCFLLLSD